MAGQKEVDSAKLYEDLMAFDEYLDKIEPSSKTSPLAVKLSRPNNDVTSPASNGFDYDQSDDDDDDDEATVEEELVEAKVVRPLDGNRMFEVKQTVCNIVQSTIGQLLILLLFSFLGAALLNFTESYQEEENTKELMKTKTEVIRDIIRNVTGGDVASTNVALDKDSVVWNTVDELLMMYVDRKESLRPYPQSPGWSYWGALYFCGTVYTTVGYGNVYPLTTEGRVITMIYALIGIPLCLVVLMNLGKAFTHAIKYLWSYVRRFYYTGSCRRARFMIPAGRLRMSVFQRFKYSIRRTTRRLRTHEGALRRRPDEALEKAAADSADDEGQEFVPYEVDTTFNLPPTVALLIAFVYMMLGSVIYSSWESWTFFESFYFVFVSFSTIGFGDVVPQHPKFFLLTAIYLFGGLAVVAMVINVCMEVMNVSISKATDRVLAAKLPRPKRVIREEAVQKTAGHLQHSAPPLPSATSDRESNSRLALVKESRRKSI